MSHLSQILWRHSLDVCTLIQNNLRFLVCFVCSLTHLLTEIRLTLDISNSGWTILLNCLETFQGCYYSSSKNVRFLVCLIVCLLPKFVTEISLTLECFKVLVELPYSKFWRHSLDFCTLVWNFHLCLSVCLLPHLTQLD